VTLATGARASTSPPSTAPHEPTEGELGCALGDAALGRPRCFLISRYNLNEPGGGAEEVLVPSCLSHPTWKQHAGS
jgi:hypothetical protein